MAPGKVHNRTPISLRFRVELPRLRPADRGESGEGSAGADRQKLIRSETIILFGASMVVQPAGIHAAQTINAIRETNQEDRV